MLRLHTCCEKAMLQVRGPRWSLRLLGHHCTLAYHGSWKCCYRYLILGFCDLSWDIVSTPQKVLFYSLEPLVALIYSPFQPVFAFLSLSLHINIQRLALIIQIRFYSTEGIETGLAKFSSERTIFYGHQQIYIAYWPRVRTCRLPCFTLCSSWN